MSNATTSTLLTSTLIILANNTLTTFTQTSPSVTIWPTINLFHPNLAFYCTSLLRYSLLLVFFGFPFIISPVFKYLAFPEDFVESRNEDRPDFDSRVFEGFIMKKFRAKQKV
jgi:hypothetical protein